MSEHKENIKDMLIEEGVKDSYLQYAMSVITDRALPDVRDGLKPVQRRIIYTMQDLNLTPTGSYIKTARIVGHCMGHYHPHGDSAIYDTLVRMARDWNLRYTLVQGQGNFGSMDGDRPAAMRYTEARSTQVTVDMLADIRQDTVDFKDNYDGKNSEPSVLPSRFPNLLCNGSLGIAVGMACSIPPHNLCEVVDALFKVIDEPEVSPAELLTIIQGPDFPTGGKLLASESLTRGYLEGRGTAVIQARYHIEENKNKEWLVFTELPFQVRRDTVKESIARLVNDGTLKGISDVRDESGRDGQRLVVELKRGENADVVLNNLYQFTPLQSTFSIIMIALVHGRPMTLNIKQFLEHFRDHRIDVIRRRTIFQLRKAEERAHELEGLRIALANLDEVIKTIRNSESPDSAKVTLKSRFELSEKQAVAILGMRLQQLTNLEVEKLEQEYRQLIETIAGLKSILENPRLVLNMIKEDLASLREKYGDARRTEISGEYAQFLPEDLIPDEDVAVVISNQGYIKRMLLNTYRQQHRGGVGVTGGDMKDDDFVSNFFVASTHDYILFFSDKGKVYWLKVYDIPQMSRTARGRALPNLIELEPDENFTSMLRVNNFDDRNVFFATANGKVKRTPLESFSRPMKRGIRALTLEENDTLIGVELTSGDNEVMLAKANGRSIRFNELDIRSMGRSARGVRGVRLRDKGDKVIALLVVDEAHTVLTLSENGYGKKTSFSEFPVKARGGLGVINMKTSERNGKIVGMMSVSEDEDLMMITHTGMIVRSPISGISTIGRNTQGVRLIRLKEGDRLVSVARAPHEELEETEEEAT
ncbi:MAG: DNA gyrase subunit A [Planctomycetota bacterium]|nr:DNA gyrase subunit A [Planctomycetota bacterium]MDA1136972.1 DNA gyrase subunit A [Planctomycetota bacterium]